MGFCFGNAFQKKGHPTEALLSRGDEVLRQQGRDIGRSLGKGERFFAMPELIIFFANPDQLSVLVILAGYYRGRALNVTAPFASACQSILLAYQEREKEFPNAVMGYFDISQRGGIPRELLSLTVPYRMYREMEAGAVDGCMETEAWEKIRDRFSD